MFGMSYLDFSHLHNFWFQYKNLAPRKKDRRSKAAAARNGQKMVNFAKIMKIIASPGRSILRLLTHDDVLVLFDRVLVRIFEKDPVRLITFRRTRCAAADVSHSATSPSSALFHGH